MSHTFKTRADDSIQSILSSLKTIGKILQDLPEDYDNREVAAHLRLADNNLDIVREELELTGLDRVRLPPGVLRQSHGRCVVISTIHVNARSKVDLNRCLETQQDATGTVYEGLEAPRVVRLKDCKGGTVVKIYDHFVGGSPFVKAYGNVSFRRSDGKVYVK